MAIREDIVTSAAQFLQDPSVSNSSVESRLSFLKSKNLTPEEIDAAFARVGVQSPVAVANYATTTTGASVPQSQQTYHPQAYPPQYAAWQPPPPVPKRDWRDWFIMATVVGGVSFGVYTLAKRYVYPLVAPPTPERLEQDKKSIEEQFDKAFALVEQLAKDTEALKAAEEQRSEKLDSALTDFESAINELKSANRRRDDEAQRIRDDLYNLKDAVPKAVESQKDLTNQRLKEINTELASLKTLISQRLSSSPAPPSPAANYLRPGSSTPQTPIAKPASVSNEVESTNSPVQGNDTSKSQTQNAQGKSLPLASPSGRASIPAWQMAMSKGAGSESSNPTTNATSNDTGSNSQSAAESSA